MIKLREVPVQRVWMLKKQSEGGRIQQRFTREVIHIRTMLLGLLLLLITLSVIEG